MSNVSVTIEHRSGLVKETIIVAHIIYSCSVGHGIILGNKHYTTSYGNINVNVNRAGRDFTLTIHEFQGVKGSASSASEVTAYDTIWEVNISKHFKYKSGHEALLVVSKIEVMQLVGFTVGEVVVTFGVYVGVEVGAIETTNPEATPLLPAVVAVLAADYAYLCGYALCNNYPTIYFDIGFSWGIYWYNFYQLGAYGKEGVFTGNHDSSNGFCVPLAITSSNFMACFWHSSVWNPNTEPPWTI